MRIIAIAIALAICGCTPIETVAPKAAPRAKAAVAMPPVPGEPVIEKHTGKALTAPAQGVELVWDYSGDTNLLRSFLVSWGTNSHSYQWSMTVDKDARSARVNLETDRLYYFRVLAANEFGEFAASEELFTWVPSANLESPIELRQGGVNHWRLESSTDLLSWAPETDWRPATSQFQSFRLTFEKR